MAPITDPSHLVNPLASVSHLETSASQLDGVPKDLEDSVRYETTRLLLAVGILLRLPQEVIAHSIVILNRYWVGADGGSLLEVDAKDAAAAALYLTAKPSATPISPRFLLTVFAFASSLSPDYTRAQTAGHQAVNWSLSEGSYETARERLYRVEAQILRVLGFETHVALPYTLCINYLQTLQVFATSAGSVLAGRAFAHLNSALLSPQLLYLTHQPSALATAAIYLAAREIGVKLPEVEWWEVFDVDREQLGFLVVALTSLEGFAVQEREQWDMRKAPLTVADLQSEIERRRMLEEGE